MKELNEETKKIQEVISSIETVDQIESSRNMIINFNNKYKNTDFKQEAHSQFMYLFGFLAGVVEVKFN
jgi:hypothetical protein